MKRLLSLTLVVVLAFTLMLVAQPAKAGGTVGCSRFVASGTTGYPYANLWIYDITAGGPYLQTTPTAVVGGVYNLSATYATIPVDHELYAEVGFWSGPSISSSYLGWEVILAPYSHCTPDATATFSGPGIPGGFVLKTITCTVAVFDAPGGQPVGSNKITGGQTWYVNPTPKKDAAGKSWTEIFVAGYNNGFVPTSCVH